MPAAVTLPAGFTAEEFVPPEVFALLGELSVRLFDPAVRGCFAKGRVVPDGEVRLIFCQGTIFVFAETPGGWRFTEIGVDD